MINIFTRVEILKKPDVTDLAGEKVMIDFDSGKYFMLVGAANDIWDILRPDISVGEIVAELLQLYEVEEANCIQSTVDFLEQLVQIGFVLLHENV